MKVGVTVKTEGVEKYKIIVLAKVLLEGVRVRLLTQLELRLLEHEASWQVRVL